MPTRIMRRTPATEEAMSYGYGDFLRDIVGSVREGASRNVERFLAGEVGSEELMEMGLAGLGGGTKIARGLGKGKFPFSLKTTDIPLWDAILRKPAYHKKAKGIERRIEFMSPNEYFRKIDDIVEDNFAEHAIPMMVEEYAQAMRKGAKFPMPALLKKGTFAQEGRHRMLAAEKLGIDRVPVLVMRATPEQKLMERFSKEGLRYDAFVEPIPGSPQFNYHQWTFYGEGPLKKATFGTKTTKLGEMKVKVADMTRKFSK